MATLTVTIPDDQAQRIIAAFSAEQNVTPSTMEEGIQIVQAAVFAHMRDRTLLYEADQAREAVLTAADDPLVSAQAVFGGAE